MSMGFRGIFVFVMCDVVDGELSATELVRGTVAFVVSVRGRAWRVIHAAGNGLSHAPPGAPGRADVQGCPRAKPKVTIPVLC
jgi:hypothetical protein